MHTITLTPLSHGLLIKIYIISFIFRECARRKEGMWAGGMMFDLIEQVDRNKEAGVAKGVHDKFRKQSTVKYKEAQ